MSATVIHEPYKLPAGMLALAVHVVFFGLLLFGFNWNRHVSSPPAMSVELWKSLPDMAVAPSPPPPVLVEPVRPAPLPPPEVVAKPDIALPDKKMKPKVETKPVVTQPEKKKVEVKPIQQKQAEQKSDEDYRLERAAVQQAEQAARERAEQMAASDGVVNEFKAKIINKIRRNIVEPPGIGEEARAEFSVTLLPGGSVLSARLTKSSGNASYDDAVERAILKSTPLPVPPDVSLFSKFRELSMIFHPEKPTR